MADSRPESEIVAEQAPFVAVELDDAELTEIAGGTRRPPGTAICY